MDKLLTLLEKNARFTNAELATMLNVSEEAVASQIKELENQGVIKGYKPLVDWDKIANDRVTAMIELKVTPQRDAGFEEIAETIMEMEEVESVYLMSGGYDLSVLVRGRTFQEVAMFVAKRLAPMKNVLSTATHFVLRRYKDMGVELADKKLDDRGTISL